MQVDVSFGFAKVYNIESFDVVKGQKFSLLTDNTGESKWFSDNDPVLSLIVDGNNADVEATATGTSEIIIMDENLNQLKKITIKVVDAIIEPAKKLTLKADAPVKK